LVKKKGLAPILRPLLAALDEPEREFAAPAAAYAALSRLTELSEHTATTAVVAWPTKNGPRDSGRSRGNAESFQDQDQLDRTLSEAQHMVDSAPAAS
jgi:hypothetical protein